MTAAVIYIPSADAIEALARCMEHCTARRRDHFGTVVGDWAAVETMLDKGLVAVMIADSRADLPPGAGLRYEFVSDYQGRAARPGSPRRERTRLIQRDGAT